MNNQPHESDEARNILKRVDQLVKLKRYDKALELVHKARATFPNNAYAIAYEHRLRALVTAPADSEHQSTEQVELPGRTLHVIETMVSTDEPQRMDVLAVKCEAMIQRAREYEAQGAIERALAEIRRAIVLNPHSDNLLAEEQRLTGLTEQHVARVSEERKRIIEELEARKSQALREQEHQLHAEHEERKKKELELRQAARSAKINQYLQRALALLEEGKVEEAGLEIRFVLLVDPENKDAQLLNREIDERHQADEEEERKKKRAAIDLAVQKHIQQALHLADEGQFAESLSILARAYVFDPANEDLQATELCIRAQEDEYLARQTERRLAEEAELRKRKEEEMTRIELLERKRQWHLREQEEETRSLEENNSIAGHLDDARTSLADGDFTRALESVARAFAINPVHEETLRLEQEIHSRTEEERRSRPTTMELSAQITNHIAAASRWREEGNYQAALDELSAASVLDPADASLQTLQEEIQREWVEFQKQDPYGSSLSAHHCERARNFAAQGYLEEALAEVALGLTAFPGDVGLEQLADELRARVVAMPGEEIRERILRHLESANEHNRQNNIVQALDEIAQAYLLDPLDDRITELELQIRAGAGKD